MRKITCVLLLSICLGAVFTLKNADAASLRSFDKHIGLLADEIVRGIDSNILIVVDQSNNMTMSMRGQMPVFRWETAGVGGMGALTTTPDDAWMRENQPEMRNAHFRASLNAQNTFGTGSRPISVGAIAENDNRRNNVNPPSGRMFRPPFVGDERTGDNNRWGRDIYAENNIIGDPYHYYSPDPDRPFLLTFRNPAWANLRFDRSNPPTGFPAALIPHLPVKDASGDIIEFGPPVPLFLANQHLVPNDSRMYQLKLVLWRLLSPEHENVNLLSRIRLGLATTFMENRIAGTAAGATRLVSIYSNIGLNAAGNWTGIGVGSHNNTFHPNASNVLTRQSILHPYGVADGVPQGRASIASHEIPSTGINRAISTGGVTVALRGHVDGPRHAGRLKLRVPFDFMYSRGNDGAFEPTQSLFAFRELIDGIEQQATAGAAGVHNRFVNLELTPHSLMVSPERAMFGRDNWLANPGQIGSRSVRAANTTASVDRGNMTGFPNAVVYYTGQRGATGFIANAGDTSTGVIMRRVETSEGFMAGTALGDVLDFFSPNRILPFSAGNANGSGDTRGFFPVTGSCQNNWVIYFSTGSEIFPGWNGSTLYESSPHRSMMRTLIDIYENSQVMRGRRWNGTDWIYEPAFSMERGIRTIVVGLVSTEDMENDGYPYLPSNVPGDDDTMRMMRNVRNNIRRMAHAGQPMRNSQGVLVPDRSVHAIFAENTEDLLAGLFAALYGIQSAQMASGAPAIPEDISIDGMDVILSTSYTVETGRQWRGALHKRIMPRRCPITREILPSQPAPEWIMRGGGLGADAGQIMMAYAATRYRRLWTNNTNGALVTVRSLDVSQMRSLFGISPLHSDDVALEFREWLINYEGDFSGILGDTENSVPIVVTNTATHNTGDSLNQPRPMVYLHTNRGVLHAIDVVTGEEIWGFIPPMVRNPMVRDKRFSQAGQFFIHRDKIEMRSRAIRILDGRLTNSNVTVSGNRRTFMAGAMGLGGPGFYMMDITNPQLEQPQFLWGIVNPRYNDPTVPADIERWGAAGSSSGFAMYENYTYMGFTVAPPEMRRISDSAAAYVGIMPAGVGYRLGANEDTQGRAIFVFGLEDGRLLRTMRNASGFTPAPGIASAQASMGMAVAPISFINMDGNNNNNDSPLREFFTSDSEGNILHSGVLTDTPVNNWAVRTIFRTRNMESPGAGGPIGGELIALPLGVTLGTGVRGITAVSGWLFSASSNIDGPGSAQELRNDENYIFALNLANHPVFSQNNMTLTPYSLFHLGAIRREGNDPADPTPQTSTANERGWRIRLRPAVSGSLPTEPEYATVAPYLFRDELWVATFTPNAWVPDGDRERCDASGIGRLYRLNASTAAAKWRSGAQYLAFENVKIVGIATHEGMLFLSVAEAVTGAAEAAFANHPHPDIRSFTEVAPGLFALDVDLPGDDVLVESGILFWREVIYR